jgi:hypothetical protein
MEAAPGAYSTFNATNDLPGMFGMAFSNFGVTVLVLPSCAEADPAIAKAKAVLAAAIVERTLMGVLLFGGSKLPAARPKGSTKNRKKSCTSAE